METEKYYVEQRQTEAIDEAQELGLAENKSAALRLLVDEGASTMGLNGHRDANTRLRRAVRRSGDALAVVAILMLGGTLFAPEAVRVPFVLLPLVSSLAMYGLDRVLGRHEPRVSAWLSRGEMV
jgi:hypothetical protein